MNSENKIHIIGIGENGLDGLTASARKLVGEAQLLLGESEMLDLVPPGDARRCVIEKGLDEAVDELAAATEKKIVVLADGDPLFYGVARYFCGKLGKERFEVVPHVSSMQLAFARVMESWEDAYLTNLATNSLVSIVGRIRTAEKVGLFTTDQCPPATVATELLKRGIDHFSVYVCENLNSPDERVTHGELGEIVGQQFAPLNVMILVRKPEVPDRPTDMAGIRLFGNPDGAFVTSTPKRALLTSAEVRAIALAEMDLGPSSVVWDIGAGCGTVAVEAARIATDGSVFAIEQDPDDHQLIRENAERFGVLANLTPVLGRAPEVLIDLPQPDAIFIGGVGRSVVRLVEAALPALKVGGRLVVTTASIEAVTHAQKFLGDQGCEVAVRMLNFARAIYQFEQLRFEAVNPSFLISTVKAR